MKSGAEPFQGTPESVESLIIYFNEKLGLTNKGAISDDAAKEEVRTHREIFEEIITVPDEDIDEKFEDCTEDETKQEFGLKEAVYEPMESKALLTTITVLESTETPHSNKWLERSSFSEIAVTSEELNECTDTHRSKSLDKNIEGLDKVREVALSIVTQEGTMMETTIKNKENITNEKVEVTDTFLAIDAYKEGKATIHCEDITKDIVDSKVSAKLLEIVPEDVFILHDEPIQEDIEDYSGLNICADDVLLVSDHVDMVKMEDSFVSVAGTLDEKGPSSEDFRDIESSRAEDLSRHEETGSGEVSTEYFLTITSESEEDSTNLNITECGEMATKESEKAIQVEEDTVLGDGAIKEAGDAVLGILTQESTMIENIQIADEIVPLLIRDVHKMENTIVAIEYDKKYKVAIPNEDITGEDIVDSMVSAGLVEIEPEGVSSLNDAAIQEGVESYGGLNISQDDMPLVLGQVDMAKIDPKIENTIVAIEYDKENKVAIPNEDITGEDIVGSMMSAGLLEIEPGGVSNLIDAAIQEGVESYGGLNISQDDMPLVLGQVDMAKIDPKIENTIVAIDYDKENKVAIPNEDITGEDIVDSMVSTGLLEIEPEGVSSLIDAAIQEGVESYGGLNISQDDMPLVLGQVDMAKIDPKIENTIVAIEYDKENKVAIPNEDITGEDIVDSMVSTGLLEIEPEGVSSLIDAAIQEGVESYGGLNISQDDMPLVLGHVDMAKIEDSFDSVAGTEGEAGLSSEDCVDYEAIYAEVFSGQEETVSVEVSIEYAVNITYEDSGQCEHDSVSFDITDCGDMTTKEYEEGIQVDGDIVLREGVIKEAGTSFEEFESTIVECSLTDFSQDFAASGSEELVSGEDMKLKDICEEFVAKEELIREAASFEDFLSESLSANDHEETEFVQGFMESGNHVVDCGRDEFNQSEQPVPADNTDMKLQEADQEQASAGITAEDVLELAAKVETTEGDECHGPGGFTRVQLWSYFSEPRFSVRENEEPEGENPPSHNYGNIMGKVGNLYSCKQYYSTPHHLGKC
ncbi:uncharacterized protein [Ranitomeya imitator]|uniref:uncharacterized protein n=1 Tax=Ranitomeya imitator TaxID=111125 RepID=UPI0037E9857A